MTVKSTLPYFHLGNNNLTALNPFPNDHNSHDALLSQVLNINYINQILNNQICKFLNQILTLKFHM